MPWEIVVDGEENAQQAAMLAVHAALLPSAQILLFGGSEHSFDGQPPDNPHEEMEHWDGERACSVYNHWQGRWIRVRDRSFEPIADNPDYQEAGGRWYPTLITLASGSVIALAGHPNLFS